MEEKVCTKCNKSKYLSDFFLRKDNNKYRSKCKECMIYENKIYRRNNPNITKAINNKWESENKEKIKITKRIYRSNNRPKMNSHAAKRHAAKLQRTPKWLTEEHFKEIESFYKKAKELENQDGIERHVDHIIPLQGETVSGLHVPWNLRVVTKEENLRKSNKLEDIYVL